MISIYQDNDLMIPESINNLERKLTDNGLEFREEIVDKEVEEDLEGAYICRDRSVFTDIYKLEKRRLERDERPRCLSHLRLKSELDKDELKKHSQQFLELLADQLRAGDLICHWRPKHFNLLLMNIEEKEAEKVINRIKRYFNSKYNSEGQININSNIYQL